MAPIQPVPDLEKYVDVEDALKRVCGNKAIYKRLLATFQKSVQYDQLCQEADAKDYEAAARTAHTIKGVVANLSMKAAYEKVVQVEAQLKSESCNQEDLAQLGEILQTTMQCVEYLTETL